MIGTFILGSRSSVEKLPADIKDFEQNKSYLYRNTRLKSFLAHESREKTDVKRG